MDDGDKARPSQLIKSRCKTEPENRNAGVMLQKLNAPPSGPLIGIHVEEK